MPGFMKTHPGSRRMSVIALMILLLVVTSYGSYKGGASGTSSDVSGREAEQSTDFITSMTKEIDDGEVLIAVDEDLGLICAASRQGRASGGSCTQLDAEKPMISISGGGGDASATHVVIVDPQLRLAELIVEVDGEVTEHRSQDDGLSIDTLVASVPERLTVLDASGDVIASKEPRDAYDGVQQDAESIDESDSDIHH